MALRDDWKKTGSDLGHAFEGLGKNIVRSARKGLTKATEWAESDCEEEQKDDNVIDAEPVKD